MNELQREASEHLRYIRETMERAGQFTDVPGWGMVAIGGTACLTAILTATVLKAYWVETWILEAFFAISLGLWTMVQKAKKRDHLTHVGPIRKFGYSMLPAVLAAVVLTYVFTAQYRTGQYIPQVPQLHALWLLLYGVAVTSGGTHSIRLVPMMGLCFMGLGMLAFFAPSLSPSLLMGLGFGGLHMGFGWAIARRFGG